MKKWIIYKTTCITNNKIYIGQHKTDNINDGYIGSGKLISSAIKKYGKDNFKREILEECLTFEDARQKEEFYIKKFNSTNRDVGYNITQYAWGGQPMTAETRLKISQLHKGKTRSIETRGKISNSKKGYKWSDQHKLNQIKSKVGKKWHHNPITLESKKFKDDEIIPNGWLFGRGNTQKIGPERKKQSFSKDALENIRNANLNPEKRRKTSCTLKGHSVSLETREKIKNSLKKFYEKTSVNQKN